MTSWNAVTDIRNGFTVTAVDYSRLHFYKKVKYGMLRQIIALKTHCGLYLHSLTGTVDRICRTST